MHSFCLKYRLGNWWLRGDLRMGNNKWPVILVFTGLITILVFGGSGFGQTAGNPKVRQVPGTLEGGEVVGRYPKYLVTVKSKSHLIGLERPELSLRFGRNIEVDCESNERIKNILDSHWISAVSFYFDFSFSEAEEVKVRLESRWRNQSIKNERKLKEIVIEPPDGPRRLSISEVLDMLALLNRSAADLVAKAKRVRGEFTPAKILSRPGRPSPRSCPKATGSTRLRAVFDETGIVTEVRILRPSGCEEYDKQLVTQVKKWLVKPATQDGRPVTTTKTIVFRFTKI